MQPSEARSSSLPASYIDTARDLYGSRHTIPSDASDIGSFGTPSRLTHLLSGPFVTDLHDGVDRHILHIPADVIRDSLLLNISMTAWPSGGMFYGLGANVGVCSEDTPDTACTTFGRVFTPSTPPPFYYNPITRSATDVKVSLGGLVPRSQGLKLVLHCGTDAGVLMACTWSNLRFYEDITPWKPLFDEPTIKHTYYAPTSTFDGISPRTPNNGFAAIRVRSQTKDTRYRSPLVVLPQFSRTDVLTASVWWSRNLTSGDPQTFFSHVSIEFSFANGGFSYELVSPPNQQGASFAPWTQQINKRASATLESPSLLADALSGKVGWLDLVVSGTNADYTLALDSFELFLNGKPIGLHAIPADQIAGERPCHAGANVQRESAGGVITASGSFNYRATDLSLPTGGPPLAFNRTYVSLLANGDRFVPSSLGLGWRHSFDHRLLLPLSGTNQEPSSELDTVIYESPTGNRLRFHQEGNTPTSPSPASTPRSSSTSAATSSPCATRARCSSPPRGSSARCATPSSMR